MPSDPEPLGTWSAAPAWPAVNGTTDTQEWRWFIKAWYALRQRPWCHASGADPRWPRDNITWYGANYPAALGGIVTGATETGITDDNATEWDGTGPVPWLAGEEDPHPTAPDAWKLVIERGPAGFDTGAAEFYNNPAFLDPVPVVIVDVTAISISPTPTLTFDTIRDYVTSGEIGDVSELVGKPYWIIPEYGVWWSERLPEWPNAEELDVGTFALATTTTLTDPGVTVANGRVPWKADQWVGKEVIAIGDYGFMVRGAIITGNTDDTLTYTGTLFELTSPDGGAVVLIAGAFGFVYQYGFVTRDPGEDEYGLPRLLGTQGTFNGSQTARITGIPAVGGGNELWLIRRHGGAEADWHLIADVTGLGTHDDVAAEGAGSVLSETREYAIIREGKVYRFGRRKHLPNAWYRGAGLGFDDEGVALNYHLAHFPDDTLQPTRFPAGAVQWSSPDPVVPGACTLQDHVGPGGTAQDWDAWSAEDEECSPADKPYSKDFPKSWRFIQHFTEAEAPSFIPKNSTPQTALPHFTLATFFHAAGINATSAEIASVSYDSGTNQTTVTLGAIDVPFTPIEAYYAILTYAGAEGGEIVYEGTFTITDPNAATIILGGDATNDTDPVDDSKGVILSFGWSRFLPREFRRMFPQQCFIPDLDDAQNPIDPAEIQDWDDTGNLGVGEWVRKDAATHYAVQFGSQPSDGTQDYDLFTAGDLALFAGDNWNDGMPHGGTDTFVPQDPRLEFYDHFNVSVHAAANESNVTGNLSGTATEGTAGRLTDPTKDWYTDNWYTGGVGHVETGTATSGDTLGLTDDTKVPTDEAGAFCHADRFVGFAGPYVGFIIEIEIDAVWHKRPIATATADGGGLVVTWAEALPESADGKAWRIREPKYEINRWQGRRLTLTKGGATATAFITHSDDTTLWFSPAASFAVDATTTYKIHEPRPGGVWKYATAPPEDDRDYVKLAPNKYWVQPRGADTTRTGVPTPVDFHEDQRENLPTIVKRFGRFMRGDYVCRTFYQEIYDAINVLVWTKQEVVWTSRAVDATPEDNKTEQFTSNITVAAAKSDAETFWGVAPVPTEESGAPYASSQVAFAGSGTGEFTTFVERRYAYADLIGVPTILASKATLYTYSTINEADDEPFASDDPPGYLAFEDFGDPVLFRQWQEWSDAFGGVQQTASRRSDRFGDDDIPLPWPPQDPVDDYPLPSDPEIMMANGTGHAYRVVQQVAVLKWDVAGGLSYIAP